MKASHQKGGEKSKSNQKKNNSTSVFAFLFVCCVVIVLAHRLADRGICMCVIACLLCNCQEAAKRGEGASVKETQKMPPHCSTPQKSSKRGLHRVEIKASKKAAISDETETARKQDTDRTVIGPPLRT